MRSIKSPYTQLIMIFVILAVTSCGRPDGTSTNGGLETSTTEAINREAVTVISRDCGWARDAKAWIDSNANGQWDDEEQPFPNIVFVFDSTAYGGERNISRPTKEDGTTKLFKLFGGCPEYEIEVSVEVPSGYRLTTPERLQSDEENFDEVFLFGFAEQE